MKADLCISKRISKRSIAEPLHVYMYINRARLCEGWAYFGEKYQLSTILSLSLEELLNRLYAKFIEI